MINIKKLQGAGITFRRPAPAAPSITTELPKASAPKDVTLFREGRGLLY